MTHWMIFATVGVSVLALLGRTGWWRCAMVLFAIRPDKMTVKRLGLNVAAPEDADRVDTILRSFAGGFNAAISRPRVVDYQAYCDSLPVLYRPFAEEGVAMGYTLRHLFRYRPADFEEFVVKPRPQYRYLYYVGLGFWSGMRNHRPKRLGRVVEGLDPLHRYLCYDGYGFKHAFFDYPKQPAALAALRSLPGYAKNAAFQGVGRAFWFLFWDRPDVLIEHARKLGEFAEDVAAGVGLAATFVNPDRLRIAQAMARRLPQSWRPHYHLGMCFALKARSINDLDRFEQDMGRLDRPTQDAVFASVRECDRIELQTRSELDQEDGYRRWRAAVTAWMAEQVEYPLAGLKASPQVLTSSPTSA